MKKTKLRFLTPEQQNAFSRRVVNLRSEVFHDHYSPALKRFKDDWWPKRGTIAPFPPPDEVRRLMQESLCRPFAEGIHETILKVLGDRAIRLNIEEIKEIREYGLTWSEADARLIVNEFWPEGVQHLVRARQSKMIELKMSAERTYSQFLVNPLEEQRLLSRIKSEGETPRNQGFRGSGSAADGQPPIEPDDAGQGEDVQDSAETIESDDLSRLQPQEFTLNEFLQSATETEKDLLKALPSGRRMTGEKLTKAANQDYNGHVKGVLANLVKRGVLKNVKSGRDRGYEHALPQSPD